MVAEGAVNFDVIDSDDLMANADRHFRF